MSVIDMQTMRYINVLDAATHVKTSKCYVYNNGIIFAVPKFMVAKAIGPGAANIRRIESVLGKKVRIIEEASNAEDSKHFIEAVISPVRVKSIELKDGVFVITSGGTQTKAALLGRNKKRFEELKRIIQDTYSADLRVM